MQRQQGHTLVLAAGEGWIPSEGIGGTEGHTGAGMGILATGVIGRGDGITGGVGPVYLLCRRS